MDGHDGYSPFTLEHPEDRPPPYPIICATCIDEGEHLAYVGEDDSLWCKWRRKMITTRECPWRPEGTP